jgi:hypothetical protein
VAVGLEHRFVHTFKRHGTTQALPTETFSHNPILAVEKVNSASKIRRLAELFQACRLLTDGKRESGPMASEGRSRYALKIKDSGIMTFPKNHD